MRDQACVHFLQWALPRLRMRWPGFRRVRGQVCKRLNRRLQELNLADLAAYRNYLETHAQEWDHLDRCCRITISRFMRDRAVFNILGERILPGLAGTGDPIRILSLGAASGEEPYSLALICHFRLREKFPETKIEIRAVEIDPLLIQRARQGCYPLSSLSEVPESWRQEAFDHRDDRFCLHSFIRDKVRFVCQDIRAELPGGTWDLILCRNQVFTYFDQDLQEEILAKIEAVLASRGFLVIGSHETLPTDQGKFQSWQKSLPIFRKG